MKEKVKCKKCGLLIDSDLDTCPYCGFPQDKDLVNESTIESKDQNENNKEPKRKIRFFDFPSQTLSISFLKSIILFFVGLIVLNLLATLFQVISATTNNLYFLNNIQYSAAINFSVYAILLGIFVIILNKDIINYLKQFKNKMHWLEGLGFGFFLMIVSSAVTIIFRLFDQSTGSNANEQGVDAITTSYPILSLLIFGIVGPICEELTYRAGLFTAIKKYNRIFAYIGTAVIFGLIHFDFSSFGTPSLVSELINIPSYIVSGLLLCYFYDYKGIGASTIAHITNNFIAILVQIISMYIL